MEVPAMHELLFHTDGYLECRIYSAPCLTTNIAFERLCGSAITAVCGLLLASWTCP